MDTLDTLLDDNPQCIDNPQRDRLAVVISGGQSQRYLGKTISIAQLEEMDDEAIQRLYSNYEAKLGSELVEPMKEYGRQLYVWMANKTLSHIYPQITLNEDKLTQDLKKNMSIDHALTTVCCEAFHKFGNYLAPLMVMATTAMNFEQLKESDECIYGIGNRGNTRSGNREDNSSQEERPQES